MAYVLRKDLEPLAHGNIDSQDFNYDYSDLKDLHPKSENHQILIGKLMTKARASAELMSARHDSWREIDKKLTAYIDIDNIEELRKARDSRKPVAIVVPLMRAICDTLTSYYMGALLGDNVFTFEGVGPEDAKGALLMTHLVQQQILRGQGELQLYGMINDAVIYGLGALAPVWDVERKRVKRYRTGIRIVDDEIQEDIPEVEEEVAVVWEGHKLYCIDAYNYLPDPSVPVDRIQDGSFVGYVSVANRYDLLSEEYEEGSDLFNVRYLPYAAHKSILFNQSHGRGLKQVEVEPYENEDIDKDSVHLINLFVKLIPSEWDLPSEGENSDYPEMWVFTIANDEVIIRARRLEDTHGLFPMVVAAPNFDCHTVSPISSMEMVHGLQGMADWMLNSYVANALRVMYSKLIIDPYRANVKDVYDPNSPVIRTRRASWGEGVEGVAKQLDVKNVAEGHVPMVSVLGNLMQRVLAAPDSLQGIPDPDAPERKTAEEHRDTRSSGVARLATNAALMYTMAFRPLAKIMASNTIQYMTQGTYIKVIGELAEKLQEEYGITPQNQRLMVSPQDIDINFDIAPVDGKIPGHSEVKSMIDLFNIAASNPILMQTMDIRKMFKSLARRLGEKNIDQYELEVEVEDAAQAQMLLGQGGQNV